jgi:hypothetical protein
MNEDGQATAVVTFKGLSMAEANQAALELRAEILDRAEADEDVRAEIEKENPDTQDFGTILVLVFGTGAAIAIAKGIQTYIAKHGSRVHIKTEAGEVIATGDAAMNIDVAKTTAALQKLAR